MIDCPVELDEDDRWTALSLLAYIIQSDTQLMSLEIAYFKEEISKTLGIDSSELSYFDVMMSREFRPENFNKIDAASDVIVAKHILKEAMRLSFVDGEYSPDEKATIVKWADMNGLEPSFVDDLEGYVRLMSKEKEMDERALEEANEMGKALLNH